MTDSDRINALVRELDDFRGETRRSFEKMDEEIDKVSSTCDEHRKETHADALKTRNAIIGFMASVALLLVGAGVTGVFGA